MPSASAEPVRNSTDLSADLLDTPLSKAAVSFAAPELGEHVMLAEPRHYRVQVISDAVGPEIVGVELALDSGRPRRLAVTEANITLGQLLSEDAELAPGSHWLFAAPVFASGLVPRAAAGHARAAKARRFFIGKGAGEAAGPSGAVWLRRPEGSYNGVKSGDSVTFDAFVFSALGAALDAPCTIALQSPKVNGQLRLPSPFTLHDVPSGVYEANVSALAAETRTTHFTVNRELGGGS